MRSPIVVALGPALVLLVAAGATAQPAAYACATPQLAFGGANGTPTSATSAIVVPDAVVLGDVQVSVRLTHAWTEELHLRLTSPAGTWLDLQTGDGAHPGGLDLVYADAGVPYGSQRFDFGCHMRAAGGSFGAFAGESSQGTWTLTLTDGAPSWNDGVLEEWCLGFFTAPQAPLPPPPLSLVGTPTVDGAHLTWTNGASYLGIDVLVDGALAAQLPGNATSHTLASYPADVPLGIELRATTPGGAATCRVDCTVTPHGPLPVPRTEKVVLVLIDGLRYTEGLGDPNATYVPRMKALAAQGTIVEPFRCDGPTLTARAIPALLCGSWDPPVTFLEKACNKVNLYGARPAFHEAFRLQRGRPAADCQYVTGPSPCPWRDSFHPSYGPPTWPQWVTTSGKDDAVLAATKAAITNGQPSLLTVYLHDVDVAGHSGNWNTYVAAIQKADQIVGDLWDFLQADPAYAGKTTMIVTNDHGRHDYDFQGHGDGCNGCRDIQLLAIGPPILKGHVSTVPRAIPDVAPTIGALLGFQMEFADGAVMTELFETCQPDLGSGGPGSVALSVCGQPLASGNQATMAVAGGPPNAAALLVLSLASVPAPFLGGTLAASPVAAALPLGLDAAGGWSLTFDGGGLGPLTVYAQCAVADAGQPQGASLSNALRLEFGP